MQGDMFYKAEERGRLEWNNAKDLDVTFSIGKRSNYRRIYSFYDRRTISLENLGMTRLPEIWCIRLEVVRYGTKGSA